MITFHGASWQGPSFWECQSKSYDDGIAQNSCQTTTIKVNQLQLSAAFTPSFEAGFHVNMEGPKAAVRDGSVFEYCRLTDTVIQAWSVLQHGYFKGNFVGKEEFVALNQVLNDLAKKYQVTPTAIALAWVLRYPGKMQAVIGTTKLQHVLEVNMEGKRGER